MLNSDDRENRRSQSGYTISEVSIATAVFSVILLVALVSFFGVSKLFYKGISITKTQEVASNILSDVQGDFRNASLVTPLQSVNGYNYYCVGTSRYTMNIGHQVDLNTEISSPNHSAGSGNFGILKDQVDNGNCKPPCDDTNPVICNNGKYFSSAIELLGQNMRVQQLDIKPIATTNLFNISLVIAYGDTDLFDFKDAADPSTIFCKDGVADQYCSVATVSTSITKENT
jgi:prepilin-type N-terminal cleavage/methylation domain-containing protein